MSTNDKLADALSSAVIQMDMAGDCIEAGRYAEALLHVRSMMRSRREVLAEHAASLAAPPAQGEFAQAACVGVPEDAVVFRFRGKGSDLWHDWRPISELRHYNRSGHLVKGPAPNWVVEYAYPHRNAVQAEHGLTSKQAWWAGVRIGLGLPPDCPRTEVAAALAQRRAQPPAPVEAELPPLPELSIGTFRKKPVAIKAVQLTRENGQAVAAWCGGQWLSLYGRGDRGEDISHVSITTLEGTMRADLGDWIIKGVKGEFYPCKPDIFAATYEPAAALQQAQQPASFQQRVASWMQECFGEAIAKDVQERGDRFLEESLELLQSHGYDRARVATLVDYVYGRPAGDPAQEVGGVMVTLAAYCLATGIDMHEAGETELARIWTKVETIRAKQASKRGLHTPLPVPPEAQQPVAQAVAWMPMESAPRDGAMLRLLVEFDEHATEDCDGPAVTIGSNNFDYDGEDRWQFAGWCWTHDHFTEGKGTPVGWLPLLSAAPPPLPEGVSEEDVEAATMAYAELAVKYGYSNDVRTVGVDPECIRAAIESYRARLAAKGRV